MSIHWNRSPSEYKVRLYDGELYCFYPYTIYNPENFKTSTLRFKVRTVEITDNEDWKTAIARNQESIPANTELEVLDVLTNFYGRWLEVIYNGLYYYIDPHKVEYIGSYRKELENESL